MSSSALTGDFAGLAKLRAKMKALAKKRLASALGERLADQTKAEIATTFATGVSPSGQRWARLSSRAGSPLVRTGALRGGFHVSATSAGVAVQNSAPYAKVQQLGGRIRKARSKPNKRAQRARGNGAIPARPFLPTSRWGPAASARLRAAASETVHRFFRS